MEIQWFRRDFFAWMACFAVLLAALAPPISRLVKAASPAVDLHSSGAAQAAKPADFQQLADLPTDHRQHHGDHSHDSHGADELAGESDPYGLEVAHDAHAAHGAHGTAADNPAEQQVIHQAAADVPASGDGHGSQHGLHLDHCPFCVTHAGSFGLAPVVAVAPLALPAVSLQPALFYRSPQPLFAWASAQPRGPPTIS